MQDYISSYLKVDDRIFTITKSGLHHKWIEDAEKPVLKEYVSMI